MRRAAIAAALALAGLAGGTAAVDDTASGQPPASFSPIRWHRSVAVGVPWKGRLVNGVQLPAEGPDFFTWDTVLERSPNRPWRRWGHDRLIATVLRVLREYRQQNLGSARVGIADISRPHGGIFDERFGGLGHLSHQNGLDVDVCYPRRDRLELKPFRPSEIDTVLAQDLVDRFVRAGARYLFVGPHTGLTGPRRVVRRLAHHDDHMHVRIRPLPGGR